MKKIFKLLLNPIYLFNYLRKLKIENDFKENLLTIGLYSSIINSKIGDYVYLGDNCQLINCEIGNHSYFNNNSIAKNTRIGSFCSIASNVIIGMGKHPTNIVSTHPSFYSNNKGFKTFSDKIYFEEFDNITIGNDVWIGNDVKIIGKINIGDGAIVASGAIVTKDIPPYAIYGGIPAKLIKFRFDESTILKLRSIKWWEFNDENYALNYRDFHDVENFIKKYSKSG